MWNFFSAAPGKKLNRSYIGTLSDAIIRYLYEAEYYEKAQYLVGVAISQLADKETLIFARAINLRGLLYLDANQPKNALEHFKTGLSIRQKLLNHTDGFVASSLSNVGLAYTELNDFDQSIALHQRAIDIRLTTNSDMIGNSYSNMASCLLRMGKENEAEKMLMQCPLLQDMSDESFLRTDNPRFVR